jgi:SAM-dependent methyltransferase
MQVFSSCCISFRIFARNRQSGNKKYRIMDITLLTEDKDPMGSAVYDYFKQGKAARLRVFSSQFEEDEIPVKDLFRSYEEMPLLEQKALQLAEGKILDVGAGSGCHTLALRKMGKEALAIDISPWSVKVMEARGLTARQVNLFDERFTERFDTILMLMNGSGIIGHLERMGDFFRRIRQLLNPGGQILMDSSDLRYLFEDEDGSYLVNLAGNYYGEIDFRMQYKQVKGDSFDWLYVDFDTLSAYAAQCGFRAECIQEGSHYDYLARLTVTDEAL